MPDLALAAASARRRRNTGRMTATTVIPTAAHSDQPQQAAGPHRVPAPAATTDRDDDDHEHEVDRHSPAWRPDHASRTMTPLPRRRPGDRPDRSVQVVLDEVRVHVAGLEQRVLEHQPVERDDAS